MDKDKVIELVKEYGKIVTKQYPVEKLILYGSWAYGNPNDDSDIDVAVEFKDAGFNDFETEKQLYKLRRAIDLRIEPIILEKHEDLTGFRQMVYEKGINIIPA